MIVEAGEPVPWTQPEELDYKPGKSPPSLGGIFPDRFHVLTRHGFVLAVKKDGFNERKMRLLLLSNERPDADISELRP